jgi:hypothetical protein
MFSGDKNSGTAIEWLDVLTMYRLFALHIAERNAPIFGGIDVVANLGVAITTITFLIVLIGTFRSKNCYLCKCICTLICTLQSLVTR